MAPRTCFLPVMFQGSKYSADGKAELAFKVFDKNHDGYITKNEMLKTSKNLTKEQVLIELS